MIRRLDLWLLNVSQGVVPLYNIFESLVEDMERGVVNIFDCLVLQSIHVRPRLVVLGVVGELIDFTSGSVSKINGHKTIVTTSGSSVQDKVPVVAEALTKVLIGRDRLQRDNLVRF